jgi:hypothetical protein
MYLEPNAYIKIGSGDKYLEFTSVNRIEITESVKTLGNKAIITLPRNYQKFDDKHILDIINTGDIVEIALGYSSVNTEFNGYIQNIERGTPLIIHVDDEFYPLKRNNLKNTYKSPSLEEVLKFIAPGYSITCPEVTLSSFNINNVSSYRVLMALKEQYGFYTKLNGTSLVCMWPYDMPGNTHTYQFYTTTVKSQNLKYRREEDVKIKIKAISNQRNGQKLTYETGSTGDDASTHTLNFGPLSQSQLVEFAEKEYKRLCFDGYTGSITGFGSPATHAGDTLRIIDPEEPDREGNYLVDEVKIIYDLGQGFERENTLSFKV